MKTTYFFFSNYTALRELFSRKFCLSESKFLVFRTEPNYFLVKNYIFRQNDFAQIGRCKTIFISSVIVTFSFFTIWRMSSCLGTTIKLRLSRKRCIKATTSAYDFPLTDSPFTLTIRSPVITKKYVKFSQINVLSPDYNTDYSKSST